MLDSTLWIDRCARELFITALLMAEPIELAEPMRQIKVREIVETDFEVPPGWYGFVHAASTGIIHRCMMDQESGMSALERLGEPESESRSPEFDGRRMVRVNGGWIILNYDKYRKKDHTTAERSKRYRERLARESTNSSDTPRVSRDESRVTTRGITQAEAEAEAEAEAYKQSTPSNSLKGEKNKPTAFDFSVFPEGFEEEWGYFVEHRKLKKAPMTKHAQYLFLTELSKRPTQALEAIRTAIIRNWTGFKWEWLDNPQIGIRGFTGESAAERKQAEIDRKNREYRARKAERGIV